MATGANNGSCSLSLIDVGSIFLSLLDSHLLNHWMDWGDRLCLAGQRSHGQRSHGQRCTGRQLPALHGFLNDAHL